MNLLIELSLILILLFSISAWYRQKTENFDVQAITQRDTTRWLLISLLLIAALGFGVLLVYLSL